MCVVSLSSILTNKHTSRKAPLARRWCRIVFWSPRVRLHSAQKVGAAAPERAESMFALFRIRVRGLSSVRSVVPHVDEPHIAIHVRHHCAGQATCDHCHSHSYSPGRTNTRKPVCLPWYTTYACGSGLWSALKLGAAQCMSRARHPPSDDCPARGFLVLTSRNATDDEVRCESLKQRSLALLTWACSWVAWH